MPIAHQEDTQSESIKGRIDHEAMNPQPSCGMTLMGKSPRIGQLSPTEVIGVQRLTLPSCLAGLAGETILSGTSSSILVGVILITLGTSGVTERLGHVILQH